MKVAWVIGGIGHGGVITVCKSAAEAVARLTDRVADLSLLEGF